jgi:glyoxylase-like metal-dependent hydrolase (beta-lactamase superfamily II)
MKPIASLVSLALLLAPAAAAAEEGFDVIVLGALGGIQDGNLSSYLIRPHGDRSAVACDAGSLVNGLKVAQEKGVFRDVAVPEGSTDSVVGHVLKNDIKGYLISHAHLDHIGGLVIASPDDGSKTIYGLPSAAQEISPSGSEARRAAGAYRDPDDRHGLPAEPWRKRIHRLPDRERRRRDPVLRRYGTRRGPEGL